MLIETDVETIGAAERWRMAASSNGPWDGDNVPELAKKQG